MELVIDSNIVISAFIASEGITRGLIFNKGLDLFAPNLLNEEILSKKKKL